MDKKDLRNIKEINGRKVNHPYELGNIFYMIFTLALVAFPCCILFVPLLGFTSAPDLKINGIDLFKFLFIDQAQITNDAMNKLGMSGTSEVTIQKIIAYILMGQGLFVGIFLLLSLIFLIFLIIQIFKGYLKKAVVIKRLALLEMILSIIFSLSFVSYYVIDLIFNQGNNKIEYGLSLIPGAIIIILFIIIAINYSSTYKGVVFEKDLKIVKKKKIDNSNGDEKEDDSVLSLPEGCTSIDAHEYSENKELKIANIIEGVLSIGSGAFANCLSLKSVTLPHSLKEIKFNAFFNCVELEKLSYNGTKEEWRKIKRGSNWLAQCKTCEIKCIDGPLVINPYN